MIGVIVALIAIGLLLIGIEFVIPGGVVGILGGVAMFAAVVLTFIEYGPLAGFLVAVLAISVSVTSLALWMKYFHRTRIGKALMLESEVQGTETFNETSELLGKIGVTRSSLHPAGSATIDGRKVDVVAETGLIEGGAQVRVVKVQGPKVVVRETLLPVDETIKENA